MSLVFGTAPNCWGVWYPKDTRQPPWQRFLDEAALAGYHIIELGPYGYLPTDSGSLAQELSARDLSLVAGTVIAPLHQPGRRVETLRTVDEVARATSALNGSFLVLIQEPYRENGMLTGPRQLDVSGWRELLTTVERAGALVRDERGLELVFHPHADTCVETPSQVERLLSETDPALVSLCLDTGHYEFRGGKCVELFVRFHRRIPYLHLKSIRAALARRAEADDLGFGEAVMRGVVCEPDDGSVDFAGLAAVMTRIGYSGRAVAEHDMYPIEDLDIPLPIARRTRRYYEALGWTAGIG